MGNFQGRKLYTITITNTLKLHCITLYYCRLQQVTVSYSRLWQATAYTRLPIALLCMLITPAYQLHYIVNHLHISSKLHVRVPPYVVSRLHQLTNYITVSDYTSLSIILHCPLTPAYQLHYIVNRLHISSYMQFSFNSLFMVSRFDFVDYTVQ